MNSKDNLSDIQKSFILGTQPVQEKVLPTQKRANDILETHLIELEDTNAIQDRIIAHNDIKKRAMQVPDEAELQEVFDRDLQQLSPDNLVKKVIASTQQKDSLKQQKIDYTQIQHKKDANVNFDDIYQQQMQQTQKVPKTQFDQPPFSPTRNEKSGQRQIFDTHLDSFPAEILAHIQQKEFVQNLKEGSLWAFHKSEEILSLIKEQNDVLDYESDFFGQVFDFLCEKYQFINKNQVQKQTNYLTQEIGYKEAVQYLESQKLSQVKEKLIVDELAQAASSYGQSYIKAFKQLDDEIEQKNYITKQTLQNKINFDKEMVQKSLKVQTEVEKVQESLLKQYNQKTVINKEMHFDHDIQNDFLVQFYEDYLKKKTDQSLQQKTEFVMTSAMQNTTQLFPYQFEQLQTLKEQLLEEDLFEEGIFMEFVQEKFVLPHQELEQFLMEPIEAKQHTLMPKFKESFSLLKTHIDEQIQVFDVLADGSCDEVKLCDLYEKFAYAEYKDEIARQIQLISGILPKDCNVEK